MSKWFRVYGCCRKCLLVKYFWWMSIISSKTFSNNPISTCSETHYSFGEKSNHIILKKLFTASHCSPSLPMHIKLDTKWCRIAGCTGSCHTAIYMGWQVSSEIRSKRCNKVLKENYSITESLEGGWWYGTDTLAFGIMCRSRKWLVRRTVKAPTGRENNHC